MMLFGLQVEPVAEVAEDGSNFYLFLIIALVVVALAMINRRIATTRNRDEATWYWLGVIFPIVALVVLLLLPPQSEEAALGRRFGRRQMVGVAFGIIGVLLVFAVAPNLITESRAFAFESDERSQVGGEDRRPRPSTRSQRPSDCPPSG